MNLYEDLGQALNPIAARDILLSVNSEPQSISSAYRESISTLASGIFNATDTLLNMLRQSQLERLLGMMKERGLSEYTTIYKSATGVWQFGTSNEVYKSLREIETADVLTIMELAEKLLLSC